MVLQSNAKSFAYTRKKCRCLRGPVRCRQVYGRSERGFHHMRLRDCKRANVTDRGNVGVANAIIAIVKEDAFGVTDVR